MNIIPPQTPADADYVSGNLKEDDYPAWAAGQNYRRGQYRVHLATHSVYQCLRDHLSSASARGGFATAINNSGGYNVGATSIVVDSVGNAGTGIDPEDTIIAGTGEAIVDSVDRSSNTITLKAPGLVVRVSDNDTVQRSGVPVANSDPEP